MFTLNCSGRILVAEYPLVMGIINVTPDSFFESSMNYDTVAKSVREMITDGATIIDVGGQSTKPGSRMLTSEEEMERVIPVIKKLTADFPTTIFSVDTFYHLVAERAVEAGASIVNDISSGSIDPLMITMVGKLKVPYIAMHMQGTPDSMQLNPLYKDVVKEVLEFFIRKIDACRAAGIADIVIDPGFGFGKSTDHNFSLLKHLQVFKMLDLPILAGVSRKGMIYRSLGITANEALNGTTALHMLALQNGAQILRVHDVKEACEAIKLFNIYRSAK